MNTRVPIDLDTSQAPELHGRAPTAEEYRERIQLILADARNRTPTLEQVQELAQLATTLTHIVECRRQQVGLHERRNRAALELTNKLRDTLTGRTGIITVGDQSRAFEPHEIKPGGTD